MDQATYSMIVTQKRTIFRQIHPLKSLFKGLKFSISKILRRLFFMILYLHFLKINEPFHAIKSSCRTLQLASCFEQVKSTSWVQNREMFKQNK